MSLFKQSFLQVIGISSIRVMGRSINALLMGLMLCFSSNIAMADNSKLGQTATHFFSDTNVIVNPNDIDNYVLALAQVISEMCPTLLNNQLKSNFDVGFRHEMNTLLPAGSNPDSAFRRLSIQQDYQQALRSIKSWTKDFSRQENIALCEEIANR